MCTNFNKLEGPQLLLDFVLCALRALRPCDPCNDVVRVRLVSMRMVRVCTLTNLLLLSNDHIIARVTLPERPKGAKDEVKAARRATNQKLGPGEPLNFWCNIFICSMNKLEFPRKAQQG